MTVALVTGATGQDGSYLCEQLLAEGVEVHAVVGDDVDLREGRGAAEAAHPWLRGTRLHAVDLRDGAALAELVASTAPDEVFNLAGMSSVARSWDEPALTAEVNAVAVGVLLQACWELQERRGSPVRVVQASSAEIFGSAATSPQDERTPVAPTNPYGAAKAYAHHLVGVYRGLGLPASSCILFNHESPRRPATFVTRKITQGAALIARGELDRLALGNLDARRDWGWAPDYVDGMVRASRHGAGGDYVLATGVARTVREFVAAAFRAVGIEDWTDLVYSDPRFTRPVDTAESRGDATRARAELGWRTTLELDEIVARMVAVDR